MCVVLGHRAPGITREHRIRRVTVETSAWHLRARYHFCRRALEAMSPPRDA